ncbi:MAG: flippase activity-associated protein Agl23 [Anaerolineales bacterium]|jgi:predicted membrane-bound mannosyltransferase/DNA-binding beta-propeller fold protein YncE
MSETPQKSSWLDRPIFSIIPPLTGEMLIFVLIIMLAIVSRLYELGARVMSHDENLHVYFSWLFSIGKGYQHTPLMHGPLQFHLLALTYLLIGASDFTARFPHAIASILTIVLLWKWRRYLGRAGTLVASVLMLISPFMLYYGRYARNEAFIGVFFVLTLYAILRYLETGKKRYLILLTITTVLHFTSKETAFIYTAQALLFLAIYLINRVTRVPWKNRSILKSFIIFLSIGVLLAGIALGLIIYNRVQASTNASQTAAPIIPGLISGVSTSLGRQFSSVDVLLILAGSAFLFGTILLIVGYGWKSLCRERSFDMLILLGTFVLPQLAAFPVTALGWNPLDYQFTWPGLNLSSLWAEAPVRTATIFLVLWLASIAIGLLWNKKHWLVYATLFWGIYIFFYTSVFTNWQGFFTGTVGSLGYWLQQQGVHRGDQPWYYYLLIQVPIYEFLPALGICLAAYFGLRRRSPAPLPSTEITINSEVSKGIVALISEQTQTIETPSASEGNYTFPLLIWWSLTSLLAYTLAGEKMPWLTVHITLPMILLTGWGLGQVIERVNWSEFIKQRGIAVTLLFVVLITSLAGAFVTVMGAHPPFQGKTLDQLESTGAFLLSVGLTLASAGGLYFLLNSWKLRDGLRIAVLVVFALLAVLTGRTAIRAAFIHPNDATEYLVYAHGAEGIKDVMDQVSMISGRIAGEQNLKVAYDNNLPNQGVSWSFKWYLRNYINAISFDKPDGSLRDVPVIIVDQQNFENIKPIVGNNYYQLDYIRLVWPNQDYFGLTWPRLQSAVTNPAMRVAIFQIWLNRNYSEYAQITGGKGLTVTDWQPSARMELFIRKDIAAQMWEYGIAQATPLQVDPYQKGMTTHSADLVFGTTGSASGKLNAPRGITIAPDGSLFVADSGNSRLVHFDATGNFLQAIGQTSTDCPYATIPPANVPIGTFCEPWAVAVSPDSQWIYVADTWNHRIQKLSADGKPVKTWGTPNYDPVSSGPFGLWGPRGIIVDSQGHVIVADTGNKRIVIYDADGNFLSQFGGEGTGAGQFDEPVGLALDSQGNLYVADTWNKRIQVFVPNSDKTNYTFSVQWDISGWSSQSLDNKPYLAIDQQGHIFATDPDSFRILEFTTSGEFVQTWGEYGSTLENFGMPSGISVDSQGRVWVSDTANNRLMRFTLP